MIAWIVRAIAASSLITTSATSTAAYLQSLPPVPNQSQVTCHDAAWEKTNLTTVEGSQVQIKLAPLVSQALGDARGQFIDLNVAVGYRTCDHQLQLRQMNCGLGSFNIYQKSSNECAPPTEPPGKSLHNEGLGVDFYCSGYAMFESSPCFIWLKSNGQKYHLYNHATESWHWSTTGK